jgi:hypothetical protein
VRLPRGLHVPGIGVTVQNDEPAGGKADQHPIGENRAVAIAFEAEGLLKGTQGRGRGAGSPRSIGDPSGAPKVNIVACEIIRTPTLGGQ